MNYKSFNLGDWIGHISGVIEDETTLDGNEMRDLVEFLSTLKQEPVLDKINKMKSEIADSLEFWDYSPNNNPLARDMLETITNFWGDMREVKE